MYIGHFIPHEQEQEFREQIELENIVKELEYDYLTPYYTKKTIWQRILIFFGVKAKKHTT